MRLFQPCLADDLMWIIPRGIGINHWAENRVTWLDYAKGVGIILVVIGHTIRGLRPEVVGSTLETYQAPDPWIYSLHMPLFFCLSGLLLPRRLATLNWSKFFRSLLLGIVLPYVIWSVAYVLIQNASPYPVNFRQTPESLLTIWRAPIQHMWFLDALLPGSQQQCLNAATWRTRFDGRLRRLLVSLSLFILHGYPKDGVPCV